MARRRLNKKFVALTTLVATVLVLTLGAFGYWKFVITKNPLPHVAEGDRLMAEGQYEDAIRAYAKAIRLKDNDPMVWVKLGDAHNMLASEDINNLYKAKSVWENAVIQDPRLLEGHRRLLNYWTEWADALSGSGRTQSLDRAAEVARNILRIAPNDKEARFTLQEAVVESWLAGTSTDPQKVDDAISELRRLQADDPDNPDLPFTIARAQAQQGFDAFRRNDRDTAKQLLDESVKTMDEVLAAKPDDPALIYRKAQLLLGIGPRVEADRHEAEYREKVAKLNEELWLLAERARSLIKPDSPDYVSIHLFAAVMANRVGKAEQSEEILTRLIKEKPQEFSPRIQLAEQLRADVSRFSEALEILTAQVPGATSKPGVQGQIARDAERRALIVATDIRLDQYALARDKGDNATAETLLKKINEDLAFLQAKEPDSARVLRLIGKRQLFQRELVESVQTLSRALTIASDPNDRVRYEVMYLLARAYELTEQTGEAEKLFRDMVDRIDYPPARIELVRLLLRKRDLEGAGGHLDILEQNWANNAEVVQLRLAWWDLMGQSDPKAIQERWAKLPEGTDQEKLRKGILAAGLNRPADAVPLLEAAYKNNRDSVSFVLPLASAYEANKQVELAKATLEEFQTRFPDNARVRAMLIRLAGGTPEEMQKKFEENTFTAIQRQPEPTRTMLTFEWWRRRNELQKAEAALAACPEEFRNDPRILDCKFQLAFLKNDYATCEQLIPSLGNQDQANGLIYRIRVLMARAVSERDPQQKSAYWKSATELAQQLTLERGEFHSAWLLLAQVLHAQKRYEEAVTAYNNCKDRQSQNKDAYEGIIRCYYAMNRSEDARRAIEEAQRMFPKDPLFVEYMLNWKTQFGNAEEVIADRERQVKDNPTSPQAWGNLAAAHVAAAQAKTGDEQKKRLNKARDVLAEAIAKFPLEVPLIRTYTDLCILTDKVADGEKAWLALAKTDQYRGSPQVAYWIGDYYRRANQADKAIKYLSDFLAGGGNDPVVRVLLADIYHNSTPRRLDEALAVLAAGGNDPRVLRRRTEMLIVNGMLKEADDLIRPALAADPNNTDMMNRLAFVLMMSKKEGEARELLGRILAIKPRDPEALYYMGLIEINSPSGDFERGLAYFQQVIDIVPDGTDARKMLADALLRRNRLSLAIQEMEALLRIDPEDKVTRIKLIETYLASTPPLLVDAERVVKESKSFPTLANDADMIHAEARVLFIKGDLTNAMKSIQEAKKLAPTNLVLLDTMFRIMMASKQYAAVEKEATDLLTRLNEPWVWSTRASARARQKKIDQALADFEAGYNLAEEKGLEQQQLNIIQAMQIEVGLASAERFLAPRAKDNPAKQFLMIQIYARTDRIDRALEIGQDLLNNHFDKLRDKTQLSLLSMLGSLYLQKQPPDLAKARESYDRLLKLKPDDIQANNNMAYLLMQPGSGGTPAEALKFSQKAWDTMVATNALDPLVMDTHGSVLLGVGRLDEGINVLRDAAARKPLVDTYMHLTEGYIKKGDLEGAAVSLRQAEDLLELSKKRGEPVDPITESKVKQLRLQVPMTGTPATEPTTAPVGMSDIAAPVAGGGR